MIIRNYTNHLLAEVQPFLEGASMLFDYRPNYVELHPTRSHYGGESHWKPEPWLQLYLPFSISKPHFLAWTICHEFQHLVEMARDPKGLSLDFSFRHPEQGPWHLRAEEFRANQAADRYTRSLLAIVEKLAFPGLALSE